MLKDRFQRVHDYLRISLTDSCNLRCSYCMPNEIISCMPQKHLMQTDEIFDIASVFVDLGIKKIRLTGGEPLVRKEAPLILERLAQLPVELTMTSNAVFVDKYLNHLKHANVRTLNISLDTLSPDKFFQLTKRNLWNKTWDNLHLLIENGFRVKLNVVVMKGVNDSEVIDFIHLTKEFPLHVRFIEFMPFEGNHWNKTKVITIKEMLESIEGKLDYVKLVDKPHATAKKYQLKDAKGTFAFITTMSAPFCGDCNRLRLTADGKMKNCLFGKDELDILGTFRKGEDIKPLIYKSLLIKHEQLGGQFGKSFEETDENLLVNRSMIKIGG
jgi:GTP 3',8-cyclase